MTTSPLPPPATLRRVALAAIFVRALYLAEHAGSALSQVTVLDSRYFELFARALAEGDAPGAFATGFRPLLYPALLAPLFALSGAAAVIAVQLLQHALGVGTAVLVALLARRVFRDEVAALAAGMLYALAPVPLFFEGQLLVETCFCTLVAALLLALATAADGQRPRLWIAAAALFVLACQLRPNLLLLLAAVPFAGVRGGFDRTARGLFLGGICFGLVAAGLLSWPLLERFQLLPSSGAVNLYLGNERGADGMVPRQDFPVTHADAYRDSVELFAEAAYRADPVAAGLAPDAAVSPAALNRYWLGRSWDELRADPLGRLRLFGRKALVLVWNGEVPNNLSFDFTAREESRLLGLLPSRFGLLLCLAAGGLLLAPGGPTRFWIAAFATTHAAGVLLFFVADRYRMPLVVPAAVLAGGGLAGALRWLRRRDTRKLLVAGAVTAATALLTFVDWTAARAALPGDERDLYFRSVARLETEDAVGALADARRAVGLAPDDPYLWLQLGTSALALGDPLRTDEALTRAQRLAPREPRIQNALGVAAERRGDPAAAAGYYRAALALAPGFAPAAENLAALELRAPAPSRR